MTAAAKLVPTGGLKVETRVIIIIIIIIIMRNFLKWPK